MNWLLSQVALTVDGRLTGPDVALPVSLPIPARLLPASCLSPYAVNAFRRP
jgi:hypothetical protein